MKLLGKADFIFNHKITLEFQVTKDTVGNKSTSMGRDHGWPNKSFPF